MKAPGATALDRPLTCRLGYPADSYTVRFRFKESVVFTRVLQTLLQRPPNLPSGVEWRLKAADLFVSPSIESTTARSYGFRRLSIRSRILIKALAVWTASAASETSS